MTNSRLSSTLQIQIILNGKKKLEKKKRKQNWFLQIKAGAMWVFS